MIKSIIKEIIIMILLCIAIVLLLGILFYDYIPTNKIVPTKVAYETPENVKEEIDEEITQFEKTEIVYEITEVDLKLYKQSSSYKPGKSNPFSMSTSSAENVDADEKNENGNVSSEGSNTNQNSTETFFNDTK